MRASVKILLGLLIGNLAMVAGPLSAAQQWNMALLFQAGGDFRAPVDEKTNRDVSNSDVSNGDAAPTAAELTARAGESDLSERSSMLLRDARRSLARGDREAASRLTAEAARLKVEYKQGDDKPQYVEVLIADHEKATQLQRAGDRLAPRTIANHLMRQAEGMILYKDYEIARSLLRQADEMDVEYETGQRSPAEMRQRLESMRAVATIRDTGDPLTPKAQALRLMAEAQLALKTGNLPKAATLSQQASALKVPESEFAENEPRPWALALDVQSAMRKAGGSVQQATYLDENVENNSVANNAMQSPAASRVPATEVNTEVDASKSAREHYQAGVAALAKQDRAAALESFRQAWMRQKELPDAMRQALQDKMVVLQQTSRPSPIQQASAVESQTDLSTLEQVDREQTELFSRLRGEIFRTTAAVEKMVANKDPRGGLDKLFSLRDEIANAQLNPVKKKQLLTVADREISEMQKYIEINISQITVDETNASRKQRVDTASARKTEVELQVQQLVEEFGDLVDQQRYPEAEAVARQAYELAPHLEVVQALNWKSKFIRRLAEANAIKDAKEGAFMTVMGDVDKASIQNVSDGYEMAFPSAETWTDITERRLEQLENSMGESVEDTRLRKLLRNQRVNVRFNNSPISEVMQILSQEAGLNIHLDERAMAAQGVTRDSPVSINLPQAITLESALSMILEAQNLTYMVKDEAVQITTKERRDHNTIKRTYYVADLVVPIPNFSSGNNNMDLAAAIGQSLNQAAFASNSLNNRDQTSVAQQQQMVSANVPQDANVLGQVGLPGSPGGAAGAGNGMLGASGGFGPSGGLGGGVVADFEPLMELIRTTIQPESWDEMGGTGTMSEFFSNLSLVISQTQEVHEEIESLLAQLRRLQDLQITIEVRFITLQDDFFERIGIDFNFNIEDNSGLQRGAFFTDRQSRSRISGIQDGGNPTANNDLIFDQDSFSPTRTVPSLTGFDPTQAASFGFAILSDIEVFFLIEASKGDQRSNILQAPKVTLFNGQTAQVVDQTRRPFVTSVIPVVGDFAVGHQPVITVLSEGTSLSVNAVATNDRRFVRLTLIPFFSQITDVDEFQFVGSRTTNTGTSVFDPTDPGNLLNNDDREEVIEGTTVQLPIFAVTTVSTTVNVPDGGTVLLGGIKRLAERRDERGVPFLSNIPYVSRLFKNVGIGRTSSSLMMMVTPRIIIQEEEEQNQVPGVSR